MTNAIIESAARALCDRQAAKWNIISDASRKWYLELAATVTPLIEANALEEAALANGGVLQNDLRDLLDVLGMPSGAQPRSPHEVFRDALVRMKLIRNDALEEAAKVAEDYDLGGALASVSRDIAADIRDLISPTQPPSADSA